MPEQTDFTTQLARLAPEVDEAAARELFEQRRQPSGTPRWLLPAAVVVLIIAGVAGLVLVTGDEADAPATPVDTTMPGEPDASLRPAPGETLIAGEEYFDVITVEQTSVVFGNAELIGSTDELSALWTEWNPGVDQPAVDFAGFVALVMTRPDNACADVVTRFDVTDQGGVSMWTPVFESLAVDACDDPLLSWIHVVAIDRAALGDSALIRIPAAEVEEVPERILEYTAPVGEPGGASDSEAVTLTPTDVVVPLPPVGEPTLHNTGAGMFYVAQHDDGDVSVLPATIDRRTADDEGVTMLRSFVVASESGGSLLSDGDIWDAWGRAATAGRSADLVGYAGRVVGDEVEVMYSDAARIEGDPEVPDGEDYPLPPRPPFEAITPEQFMTLSSSGPIWRLFDAELVVENGVGRICDVDTSGPHPWERCGDQSVTLDTAVTSDQPGVATWFVSPILVFQDPGRGLTEVIPLSGNASHNDAAFSVTLEDVSITCTEPTLDTTSAVGSFTLEVPTTVRLAVVDGSGELGWIEVDSGGVEQIDFLFALDRPPGPDAELVIEPSGGQGQRFPVPDHGPTTCAPPPTSQVGDPGFVQDEIPHRVISTGVGGDVGSTVMWASTPNQLASLLGSIEFDEPPSGSDQIDFETEVALLIGIDRNECDPFLVGLLLFEGVVRPQIVANDAASCGEALPDHTVLVSVPRSELGATTTVAIDPRRLTVVQFATDSGRLLSIGDDWFEFNGADIECDNTGQLVLSLRGHGDGVTAIEAEALIGDRQLPDPTYPRTNPSDGFLVATIPIPDDVDLSQPLVFTVRPTGSAGDDVVSPPIALDSFDTIPETCP